MHLSSAPIRKTAPRLDPRDHILFFFCILLFSPLGFSWFSGATCTVISVGYWAAAILLLPHICGAEGGFEDLNIKPGALLSLVGSITAFILQGHNVRITFAMQKHSDIFSRPIPRLIRTWLYVEAALNGSSQEKEQIASWLRWTHRRVNGSLDAEARKEFGLAEGDKQYGYIDDLKVYVMQTLTWSTIAFLERFGSPLSGRARDGIVIEYACAAMRLGVPRSSVPTTYERFLKSFERNLDLLEGSSGGSRFIAAMTRKVEASFLDRNTHWLITLALRTALLVGHALLPQKIKTKYPLRIVDSRRGRAFQRVLCAVLWFIYPFLIWIPLRGLICFFLILDPQLRPVFCGCLKQIHSMDLILDVPIDMPSQENTFSDSDVLYDPFRWLSGGNERPSIAQIIFVRTLRAQLQSKTIMSAIHAWAAFPVLLSIDLINHLNLAVKDIALSWRCRWAEWNLFSRRQNSALPVHVGVVMDGNRRYARGLGLPVLAGHTRGAATASHVLGWWLKHSRLFESSRLSRMGPQYLTCWALSSDNFKRGTREQDGLFSLMISEFRSLAFTNAIHLCGVRVRFIGSERHLGRLPNALKDAMRMVEEMTASHDRAFLQIAVGYGGREEVVSAVQALIDEGMEITEDNISSRTYCAEREIPPVSLIFRTSEQRTSGFFLWDTQAAELHFVEKLWPQLNELDWLHMLSSFSRREMRGGK